MSNCQVLFEVERTIADCEAAAEELQRQLDQRRFVVHFLRQFLLTNDTVTSRDRRAPAVSRDPVQPSSSTTSSASAAVPPVPPVRLRHRVGRRTQLLDEDQVGQKLADFYF